ncbi:hypothetical protein QBC36DRAFT_341048 [Triangularia setosa]|uniref:Uncharacterized protein n=1 Tax=Triangularia setosa TaxID=2587417 RepID=A0AAN7A0L4_9PEZI|nr:hypothetical protein QBC36DRAFT_341048 [Podospora setosa]
MNPDNKFSFCEDGDRPITTYTNNAKFRPADQVYVRVPGTTTREGPYTVAAVDNGRYKLCDENKTPVEGDRWLKEEELEFYDPFE